MLDLGWFDKAYFDRRGYNENKERIRLRPGLHHSLLPRLAEHVRTHRAEFIGEWPPNEAPHGAAVGEGLYPSFGRTDTFGECLGR